ncbi:alpha/beta fold hydrolase [Streptomyces durmitorensis]|uniref:Thioesterase domain-containing protein n=1 Tax=Streptomyces durmitorensis TaxID=319947 RepID=A0ABY4PKQ4_9ACTN|nr:thioesterase domain-containing protein [Streptomyces durmitorensis]UQT53729.1 thioesterase domain-containing protein [Streptomyces durmitorensis]
MTKPTTSERDSVPLLCLPFAGGGANFFRPWNKLGLPGVVVTPLQLPGRERQLDEEPFRDVHVAADALLPAALKAADEGPVALLGHCFLGAVLAYELTRRITETGRNEVVHLFVSAARPPSAGPVSDVAALTDDAFLKHVEETTGRRYDAFDVPEIRELLIPTLRADYAMDESYRPSGAAAFDVPMTGVYAADDTFVSRDDVAKWQDVTTAPFSLTELPGGHMYPADDPAPLLALISETIAAGRAGSGRRLTHGTA